MPTPTPRLEAVHRIASFLDNDAVDLDLRSLNLASLPRAFDKVVNRTERLFLGGNQLAELPEIIGEMSQLRVLELDDNSLTDLPDCVRLLTNLESLSLANNQLVVLPKTIGSLKKLKELRLDGNQLAKVPAELHMLRELRELSLLNNQLSGIPEAFSSLSKLTHLSLAENRLDHVPGAVRKLSSLKSLNLGHNQISKLPKWIGCLVNLESFDVSCNALGNPAGNGSPQEAVPHQIGELTSIRELMLQGNEIVHVPQTIGNLSQLERLVFGMEDGGNPITVLPRELMKLRRLKLLSLHKCTALRIPPEIVAKQNQPGLILDYYFQSSREHGRALNEAKLLVVGEASVGKTSLIKRLLELGPFDPSENQTHGIVTHRWQVKAQNKQHIQLNVWDFGGQEIMHATHQFFLTRRSIYVLVVDSRQNERQSRIEYWLKLIQSFGENSPVIVVCNKCDQQSMDLDWSGLRDKYPQICHFVRQASCVSDQDTGVDRSQGISELSEQVSAVLAELPHVDTLFPQKWFDVKVSLESTTDSFKPYSDYRKLCVKHGISDEEEQLHLIGFLHDLGIVLHFHDHPLLRGHKRPQPALGNKCLCTEC